MTEIVNRLPEKRVEELASFFTFLGIYDDERRSAALKKLLVSKKELIRSSVCVEAGAGLGNFSRLMLDLGAKKVYCVEENSLCCEHLAKRFRGNARVRVINSSIERFRPKEHVSVLFQELYGPMLMDESLLSLERLKFEPSYVIPNEGFLVMEAVTLKDMKDDLITKELLSLCGGALITDLFLDHKFRSPQKILRWKAGQKTKTPVNISLKTSKDVLVFGVEIWHDGKRICGTADCENWPYVYTPIISGSFDLSFRYRTRCTDTSFSWR